MVDAWLVWSSNKLSGIYPIGRNENTETTTPPGQCENEMCVSAQPFRGLTRAKILFEYSSSEGELPICEGKHLLVGSAYVSTIQGSMSQDQYGSLQLVDLI